MVRYYCLFDNDLRMGVCFRAAETRDAKGDRTYNDERFTFPFGRDLSYSRHLDFG